jgi:hypothetical protein
MQTNSIPYVLGSDSITVYLKGKPYPINKQAHTYPMVLAAVKSGDVKALENAINIRQGIADDLSKTSKLVRVEKDKIFYADREVQGLIASRIFETIRLGLDTSPMVKFLERLMQNPSKRAVDELFGFMEACTLPITPDGYFLAYKRVNNDYYDVHSRTVLNKPAELMTQEDYKCIAVVQGKKSEVTVAVVDGVSTVSMPRNLVNDDRDQTCSEGLHFCSYNYLSSFGGARVVVLKIDPADVVSIPSDYNNSKGRTAKYQVVDELELNGSMPAKQIQDGFVDTYSKKPAKVYQPVVAPVVANPDVLSDSVVRGILSGLAADAYSVSQLAKMHNRSERTIRRIRDRESYKHVA